MKRTTIFSWVVVCALVATSCSTTPGTPLSPSGATPSTTFVNPDGSNLKVTAPTGLSPNGETLDTLRPTLTFSASTGVYQALSGASYDLEVVDANGTSAYLRTITSTSHTVEVDAPYAASFTWHVRARLGEQVGPWSGFAQFRTPDPPPPPPPPTPSPTTPGGLPFPVPAACGPGGPDDRFACAAAVAALSVDWQGCRGGRGVSCHRFTRQVVFALAQFDQNWKMIQAAPGGNACNCFVCGPSDGTMFREDTTVYAGNRVYDMIVGAGGPTPSLGWSLVPGPRAGDLPSDAPLCTP